MDVLGTGKSPSYKALPPILEVYGEWEGGAIVREIPTPVGLFLFGTIRDVMHWLLPANSGVGSRAGTRLTDASGIRWRDLAAINPPLELEPHLSTLVRAVEETVGAAEVGHACVGVARWANAATAPYTELAYLQAGAIALPDSLVYALETAKLARELSQYGRSETWFRSTIKRARVVKDRATYVLGYLGLGNLYGRIGNGPAAKVLLELALRQSERWRLRELVGRAHHDLIRVWTELRDLRRAYEHAGQAARYYGDSTVQQVRLAADVATVWLRAGASDRSLAIFETIYPYAPDAGVKAVWAAQLARSVANSGLVERYAEARMCAAAAIGECRDLFRRADAEVQLALADLALERWDAAAAAAESAFRTATAIGAAETQMDAERALENARAHRREGAAEDLLEPPALSRVADRLARSLQEAVAA